LGRICHGALDGTPALHRPLAVPPASLCSGAGKAATKVVATEASHLGSSKCQFKRLGVEIWQIFLGLEFWGSFKPSKTKGRIKTLAYETVPFAAQFFAERQMTTRPQ